MSAKDREAVITFARYYYGLIASKEWRQAYGLRSAQTRERIPYEEFVRTWSNNRSLKIINLTPLDFRGSTYYLKLTLESVDENKAGKEERGTFEGTLILKKNLTNGQFAYDDFDMRN